MPRKASRGGKRPVKRKRSGEFGTKRKRPNRKGRREREAERDWRRRESASGCGGEGKNPASVGSSFGLADFQLTDQELAEFGIGVDGEVELPAKSTGSSPAEKSTSKQSSKFPFLPAGDELPRPKNHRDNRAIRDYLIEHSPGRPRCFWCDDKLTQRENLTVDHVIARSSGGAHDVRNAVLSCMECQREKAAWEALVDLSTEYEKQLAKQEAGDKSHKLAELVRKKARRVKENAKEIDKAKRRLLLCERKFCAERGYSPLMRGGSQS